MLWYRLNCQEPTQLTQTDFLAAIQVEWMS